MTQVRTPDEDGYSAVQIAFGAIDPRKVNKPLGRPLRRRPASRRAATSSSSAPPTPSTYTLGQELTADVFEAGQIVDVVGTSKGKGFAGVMKRHGFKGLGAAHGVAAQAPLAGLHRRLRDPGSRVQGHQMAGRMGHDPQTTMNLTVHAVDAEKGLMLIKGAVPGPKGGLVLVRTAAKGA